MSQQAIPTTMGKRLCNSYNSRIDVVYLAHHALPNLGTVLKLASPEPGQANIKAPFTPSRMSATAKLELGIDFPDLGALESLRAKGSGPLLAGNNPGIVRSGRTRT